jgi:CDP-glucose 4,6-dehydratase
VRTWGPGAVWRRDAGEHRHEAGYLKLDSSKARRELGWRPAWDFDETVERTVSWYRAEQDGAPMAEFTRAQIQSYFGR